jgi:hypothetical protein
VLLRGRGKEGRRRRSDKRTVNRGEEEEEKERIEKTREKSENAVLFSHRSSLRPLLLLPLLLHFLSLSTLMFRLTHGLPSDLFENPFVRRDVPQATKQNTERPHEAQKVWGYRGGS